MEEMLNDFGKILNLYVNEYYLIPVLNNFAITVVATYTDCTRNIINY